MESNNILLGLHFILLMAGNSYGSVGLGTTPSTYSLRSFSSKRRIILAFQAQKFVSPSNLSSIFKSAHHCDLPRTKPKNIVAIY
jgi:hypothetical protein